MNTGMGRVLLILGLMLVLCSPAMAVDKLVETVADRRSAIQA